MQAPAFWRQGGPLAALLAPAGRLYALAGRLRRALVRPARAACPVICVGNLTAGGSGKTPTALALAERLVALGRRPVFLTRGYGGRERGPLRVDPARHDALAVGDEPLLLAARAPTVVARDRAAGARLAATLGDVIVMDDGFQNPGLAKDLALLVFDGGAGLGNGRCIPAGPLREGLAEGLARAQGCVLIGADATGLAARLSALPLLRASLEPAARDLAGRRVLAFAGIGRPEKLFATLRDLGAELVATRGFPDHHPYGAAELAALRAEAAAAGAVLVTTAKDLARLPPAERQGVTALAVRLVFADRDALDRLLRGALRRG
jgi:tetraacyldisaccharide 4'-kinase